jgi:hypothetical protein
MTPLHSLAPHSDECCRGFQYYLYVALKDKFEFYAAAAEVEKATAAPGLLLPSFE